MDPTPGSLITHCRSPDSDNSVGDLFRREVVRIDLVLSGGRILRDPAIEDLLDFVGKALYSRQ
jgi:hypothetical protein